MIGDRDKNIGGWKRILVLTSSIIFTLFLTGMLVGLVSGQAIRAEARAYPDGDTIVVYANNPGGATLTVNITNIAGTVAYIASSSDTSIVWTTPSLAQGSYRVRVSQADGGQIYQIRYTIGGSIIDTGYRDLVFRVIGVEWIAITVLAALAIGCISLGRFAGTAIFTGGVTVLAMYETGTPSWIIAVLAVPAALVFAYALNKARGGSE